MPIDCDIQEFQLKLSSLLGQREKWRNEPGEEVPAWILPPRSCDFIVEIAKLYKDPTAFEFGSGKSTHHLRSLCQSVTSIEDSAEWLGKTEAQPGGIAKRAQDLGTVIPLTICWDSVRPFHSFSIASNPESVKRLSAADIILIDSPPNPATREHALLTALRYCPIGSVVIVDDLEVSATERFVNRIGKRNSRELNLWVMEFDHRLGVFFKYAQSGTDFKPIAAPTLREIVGQWIRTSAQRKGA